MGEKLILSPLAHAWILDLDGTILKHNGYKLDGKDSFVSGAEEFLKNIPQDDMVIFLTSRKQEYKEITEKFLEENAVRYDLIVYEAPYGERILVNDRKPSGLDMAVAVNVERDSFNMPRVEVDESK